MLGMARNGIGEYKLAGTFGSLAVGILGEGLGVMTVS
jgi:hypothetical protein